MLLISGVILFIPSRIMSLSSTKIILLCFPIISMMRYFLPMSPISFKCSISIFIALSNSICVTDIILPFNICFLRSIQKAGELSGDALFSFTKHMRGIDGLAEINNLLSFPIPLIVSIISSFSG